MIGPAQDKVAVITGAGHGIGPKTTDQRAENGATVYVTDIDGAAAKTMIRGIRKRTVGLALDVRAAASLEALRHGGRRWRWVWPSSRYTPRRACHSRSIGRARHSA
jgi:NAD(P)-dependent dehydrogenase (short-subunit alcohol dehydrogenase family)